MVKMEQCFLKAKMLFKDNDPAFVTIHGMYERTSSAVAGQQKKLAAKKFKRTPFYFVALAACAFALFMTLGSFISGSAVSGVFGMLMLCGTVASILLGQGTIPCKYPVVKLIVFVLALAMFVPLVMNLG